MCALFSRQASAQESAPERAEHDPSQRLVVLRSDGPRIDDALKAEVDRAVLETVLGRARFSEAYASPVPYAEVELAAGCDQGEAGCLQRIAATLDTDWLLVRDLVRDGQGRVFLTLIAHDGSNAIVTRRAIAEISPKTQQRPGEVVPLLVDKLYPGRTLADSPRAEAPVAAATSATPLPAVTDSEATGPAEPGPRTRSPAKIVGWSATSIAGALVVAGIVVGSLSRGDQRQHERLPIEHRSDTDRAYELLDQARRRTDIANGLLFGGAGLGAIGLASLAFHHFRPPMDDRVSVRVKPARAGVAVALRATWQGGL